MLSVSSVGRADVTKFCEIIFRSKVAKLDLVKEYEKRRASDGKENLNMVVIGQFKCILLLL